MDAMKISRHKPKGTATVEFVVVLPILLMVMLAIVELSRAWMTLNIVAAAAREGARVGVVTPLSGGAFNNGPAIARINAVLASANLTAASPPTVTCASPCSSDSPVTTIVTVNFSTFFPVFVPGLAGPIALTNQAIMRYE